jgi:hypothetical protein
MVLRNGRAAGAAGRRAARAASSFFLSSSARRRRGRRLQVERLEVRLDADCSDSRASSSGSTDACALRAGTRGPGLAADVGERPRAPGRNSHSPKLGPIRVVVVAGSLTSRSLVGSLQAHPLAGQRALLSLLPRQFPATIPQLSPLALASKPHAIWLDRQASSSSSSAQSAIRIMQLRSRVAENGRYAAQAASERGSGVACLQASRREQSRRETVDRACGSIQQVAQCWWSSARVERAAAGRRWPRRWGGASEGE